MLAYNNGPFVLYLDGSAYQTSTSSNYTNNATPASDTYIGNTFQRGISQGIVNGQIDQVRVFGGTILDQNAVTVLYNETTTTAQSASIQSTLYDGTDTNITYTQDKPYYNINVGFKPDLVWTKSRSNGLNHTLFDSIRGVQKSLRPNATTQEQDRVGITSFDSSGFSIGSDDESGGQDGYTYVSWCWKAGGTPTVTNAASAGAAPTLGSVMIDGVASTSALAGSLAAKKISANTTAGFSIIRNNGTADYTDTIAHGLSAAPELVIQKTIGSVVNWFVLFNIDGTGGWDYAHLNTSAAFLADSPVRFAANSTTINNWGWNNYDMINYCFHSVEAYQKIGTYTGNASSDGPFIHTGFKPAFLMIKTTGSDSWFMVDNKRETSNSVGDRLFANSSAEEGSESGAQVNFLSNGFKVKGSGGGQGQTNSSGTTYIYMAIAEDSEKHSNAVATLGDGNEFIQDDNYPEDNFNIEIYTGNASTRKIVTDLDADFVWIKERSATGQHSIFDSVRGVGKRLDSSSTSAESNAANSLTSFNSNGFGFGNESGNNNNVTNVAWSWKAAGHEYKSAHFNGSSSYITTGLTLPADSTMAFSFWFKWSSNQSNSGDIYLLSDLDSSANGNRIDIRVAQSYSNQIYIDIGNGSSRDNKATGFVPAVDTLSLIHI